MTDLVAVSLRSHFTLSSDLCTRRITDPSAIAARVIHVYHVRISLDRRVFLEIIKLIFIGHILQSRGPKKREIRFAACVQCT